MLCVFLLCVGSFCIIFGCVSCVFFVMLFVEQETAYGLGLCEWYRRYGLERGFGLGGVWVRLGLG